MATVTANTGIDLVNLDNAATLNWGVLDFITTNTFTFQQRSSETFNLVGPFQSGATDPVTSLSLVRFFDGSVQDYVTFSNLDITDTDLIDNYSGLTTLQIVSKLLGGNDVFNLSDGDDRLSGGTGHDIIRSNGGADIVNGGDGSDTIDAGWGNDVIVGGVTNADLRDVIYAGAGNDNVDGAYGNDLIYGQDGDDVIAGGFGSDELQGQNGNDVITGSALSDLVYGGAGNDFVNGGFGHDRINGGTGADKFYHLGILDHGSDWVQDFTNAEGDVLLFGNASASASDFQINYNHTANAAGERSGDDNVQEAFVIYKPTGQIIWALVDGAGESSIMIDIGGTVTDLV